MSTYSNNVTSYNEDGLPDEVCKEKGLILSSPFDDIKVNVSGCKPPNNQKDESRVYLLENM